MITRRSVLRLAATAPMLGSAFAMSKGEFWDSKDPSQWSDKETKQMLTKSPWAKSASVESESQRSTGMPGGGGMGRGGGGGGMGGGGGYGGMGGGGRSRGGGDSDSQGGGTPNIHAVVRWESAAPVSAALKQSVPAEAADSYIISVTGLRMRRPESENESSSTQNEDDQRMGSRLTHATRLEIKGKDSISPSGVQKVDDVDGPIWRFRFARNGNPITVEDKEVTFVMNLGRMTLKAKFPLKEMTYKDQLAL